MRIIGIDPGKSGGVAVLDKEGKIILVDVLDDAAWFASFVREQRLAEDGELRIFLEKAQVFAKNGAVGMFNYGVGFGELLGVLATLAISHELVPPQTWTRAMHAGHLTSNVAKDRSRHVVKRLFPAEDLRNPNAPKSIKAHDGIIDALLIAEYGRRKMRGLVS